MSRHPVVAVLCGGTSAEREVSLGSGKAVALALARSFPTCLYQVDQPVLPAGLDPLRHVVLSTLHGTFGEDGGMQRLLDVAGVHYAGCDASSSEICFNKVRTKQRVVEQGVRVCPGISFDRDSRPGAAAIVGELGERLILKPSCNGSSVGLMVINSRAELETALSGIEPGEWLVERRVIGRELTVGVLNGRAMGVVEIRPKSGLFDYTSKYTKGLTEYLVPAPIPEDTAAEVRRAAESAYRACGCRDYARMDFMLSEKNELFFLEINTLPGMKDTSLLPMSARCAGLDYTALVRELIVPALERFKAAGGI